MNLPETGTSIMIMYLVLVGLIIVAVLASHIAFAVINSNENLRQHNINDNLATGTGIIQVDDRRHQPLSEISANNSRFSNGFIDGSKAALIDAQNGDQFNSALYGDPNSQYASVGQHTTTYCTGWADGYASTWDNHTSLLVPPLSIMNNQLANLTAPTHK